MAKKEGSGCGCIITIIILGYMIFGHFNEKSENEKRHEAAKQASTSGTTWYGTKELFGRIAPFAASDRKLYFSRDSGHEMTLRKVAGSNFRTEEINHFQF